MANELAKYLASRRRYQDENAVKRQVKIARQHGLTDRDLAVKEPHRMAKHHAMDCGQAGCYLCGNPRRNGDLTISEKSFIQTECWDFDTEPETIATHDKPISDL